MNAPAFRPLAGIYEPSALQQLPDGRFLVVEDEKDHPFSVFTLAPDDTVQATALTRAPDDAVGKLDDLEGLTCDALGWLYAVTSHSRDGDGEEKKSRHKLARFRIEGNRIVAGSVLTDLKPRLLAVYPELAPAAALLDVKNAGGFNIEALEWEPATGGMLIGLRSPLRAGRALLARLDNPASIFDAGEAPRFAPSLIALDLGGHGVRGLSWIPALQGFLLVSGPVARQQTPFGLWFWTGQPDVPARPVTVPGLAGFEHAEGIAPARLDGRDNVLVVSDDGNRAAGRCARYLRIDPAQLAIG